MARPFVMEFRRNARVRLREDVTATVHVHKFNGAEFTEIREFRRGEIGHVLTDQPEGHEVFCQFPTGGIGFFSSAVLDVLL